MKSTEHGERLGGGDLIPLVYTELRRLAACRMAHERPGHTLQPTALVNEAYLRLAGSCANRWKDRDHFFGAAAEAMRRILVENARRKKAARRGGGQPVLPLQENDVALQPPLDDILAVHEALDGLAEVDAAAAELVKLRFFVGLTHAEAAHLLGMSRSTADRAWVFARAWLYREIQKGVS